jgi:hypothetical protein
MTDRAIPSPGAVAARDEQRQRIVRDPRARELAETLRGLYRLYEQEPEAGELCRLWTRSRNIAAGLVVEWEPVGNHIRQQDAGPRPDDPDTVLRALRGLLKVTKGQDDQRMVVRLLARVLYELVELRQRVPSADEICRTWDRSVELARALSAEHGVHVTFRNAEQWKMALSSGHDREQMLKSPWDVSDTPSDGGEEASPR